MDVVVVDASVAIKWVYSEELSDQAVALRENSSLIAPELLIAECDNILWKKVRLGQFSREEAMIAGAALTMAQVELVPLAGLALGALRLSLEIDHPAYDCFYLELCRIRGVPMVTADDRLVRKLQTATSLRIPKPIALSAVSSF